MLETISGAGALYIVATPIGNLSDISQRALDILTTVDLIAAEDTRHSKRLLSHYGINNRLLAFHDHNERKAAQGLIEKLIQGESIALISDAGTPLISDPGYYLVKLARDAGIAVFGIPGPSSLITALSVSGLATDRFIFEGFLPAKSQERKTRFESAAGESCTVIFFESSHRILASMLDMLDVIGEKRTVVVARELTKLHETVLSGSLVDVVECLQSDKNQQKGEFVVLLAADADNKSSSEIDAEAGRVLKLLMKELPLKKAAKLASEITGVAKNSLYKKGLEMNGG